MRFGIAAFVIAAHAAMILNILHHSKPVKRARTMQAQIIEDYDIIPPPADSAGPGRVTECKHHYIGFGYSTHGYGSAGVQVGYVAQGYPAWRIGLKEGDVLYDEPPHRQVKMGQEYAFVVERNGLRFTLWARPEKICQT